MWPVPWISAVAAFTTVVFILNDYYLGLRLRFGLGLGCRFRRWRRYVDRVTDVRLLNLNCFAAFGWHVTENRVAFFVG